MKIDPRIHQKPREVFEQGLDGQGKPKKIQSFEWNEFSYKILNKILNQNFELNQKQKKNYWNREPWISTWF